MTTTTSNARTEQLQVEEAASIVSCDKDHPTLCRRINDGLDKQAWLLKQERRRGAKMLTMGAVAYGTGCKDAFSLATAYLQAQDESPKWKAKVAVSMWIGFCWAGQLEGVRL